MTFKLNNIFFSWVFWFFISCLILVTLNSSVFLSNFKYSFLFEANFSQFKEWYPSFYLLIYPFVKIAPILFCFGLILFIWKKKQSIKRVAIRFKKPDNASFREWHKTHFILLLVFLTTTLVIYSRLKVDFNSQLSLTRLFLLTSSFQLVFQFLLHRKYYIKNLSLFLLKKDFPFAISIFRILFFIYLLVSYINSYFRFLPQVSLSKKESLPFLGWLIDIIPVNRDIYFYVVSLGVVACLFIIVGFKSRFFLVVNAICCFYIMATPSFFGKLWHYQIFIWISWIFMFSRCYDVFSIDAYLNKRKLVKSANYTFPIRIIWLHLGLIYFWAGFYKLWDCGFDWALSKSMLNQIQLEWLEAYDKIPWIRIDTFPVLVYVGGFIVVLFELSYIFLLFKRVSRTIAAIGGILMHQLIGYFMYISFLKLQIVCFFYLDLNWLFKKRRLKIKERGGYSKFGFYFCLVILGFNSVAGMFNINTYPFSSYPSYSEIVPDKIKRLKFESQYTDLDMYKIGEKNNFRWENYSRIERKIIFDYENGENVEERIKKYWEIWVKHNPELESWNGIKVTVQERPVSPEGKNKIRTIKYICTLENFK